jgi:hypothetical protein
MFKRLALSTALLAATLGVTFAPAASAANRNEPAQRDRAVVVQQQQVDHRGDQWRDRDLGRRVEHRDRNVKPVYYDSCGR